MQVPLFPLHTVLFPGGPLPLRIFEARYLDMVSDRLRRDAPFGVVLIRDGDETGEATMFEVGTLAHIRDWDRADDGLLGLLAVGGQRFCVDGVSCETNGLYVGDVSLLADDAPVELPAGLRPLATALDAILDELENLYRHVERQPDDAGWVAWRYLELLPVDAQTRQRLLAESTPLERLQFVAARVGRRDAGRE